MIYKEREFNLDPIKKRRKKKKKKIRRKKKETTKSKKRCVINKPVETNFCRRKLPKEKPLEWSDVVVCNKRKLTVLVELDPDNYKTRSPNKIRYYTFSLTIETKMHSTPWTWVTVSRSRYFASSRLTLLLETPATKFHGT